MYPYLIWDKKVLGSSLICHPNRMVLRVLNQQRSWLQSPSGADVSKRVLLQKCSPIKSSGIVLHALKRKRKRLTLSSSSFMVIMETETNQNIAEQRVKKLKQVKQRVDWQHYSNAHHRPPKQQYKSKTWTIAIILKLTFVALNSWTYRIGY